MTKQSPEDCFVASRLAATSPDCRVALLLAMTWFLWFEIVIIQGERMKALPP